MYIASNGIKTAVVLHDDEPVSPRDPDYQDNLGTMTCWHNRYTLGDAHNCESPRRFLTDLIERHIGEPEFFRFVQGGGVWQLRLDEVHPTEPGAGDGSPKYVLSCRDADMGENYWTSTGCLVSQDLRRVSGPELEADGLLEYLDFGELRGLLCTSESVVLRPLHLYDHSGVSISTSTFIGRARFAEWDSGWVGYIHMDRKTAMDNLAMPSPDGPKPLDDGNWKAQAVRHLEAEVKEYDNYLRGEVYGYRLFEGLEEVDSCWGFNPGDEGIEELMNGELRGWYGSDMEFEFSHGPCFDIDDFFDENPFPELRERIESEVLACVSEAEGGPGPYPFELSPDEIRDPGNGILRDIVDEVYEEHVEPSPERIREAVEGRAGISREVKPKLTAADLDPNRDYTVEELMELAKRKAAERGACHAAAPKERKTPEMGL